MIEQAAIRSPTEKQSAFFDRVTGQLQLQQFSSTGGLADSDVTDAIERAYRAGIKGTAVLQAYFP